MARSLALAFLLMPAMVQSQVSEYNYATGNVKGVNYVGGLTGRISADTAIVRNSYARGNVTGDNYTGGFAGSNSGIVENSYSTGKVTGTTNSGGFAGTNSGSVVQSYWDMQTSTKNTSGGGTGKNTDPMTYPYASDTYSGWDFNTIWKADQSPAQNNGYPVLIASDICLLTVRVLPIGAGNATGSGYYKTGQQALLKATSASKFTFKNWLTKTGEVVSNQSQVTLPVSGNAELIALFESSTTSVATGLAGSKPRFRVYPNPATDHLWVEFISRVNDIKAISLVNVLGQTIRQFKPEKTGPFRAFFSVSGLKDGLYLVRVEYNNRVEVEKVMVN